jgi:O-antigen/teichoic acid export membrane protein
MGIAALVIALATTTASSATAATAPDPDLAARFQLATVPGVHIDLAGGPRLAPSSFASPCPKPTVDPLCDINWRSAPEQVVPLATIPETTATVLVASERGDPLVLVEPGRVVLAALPQPALRHWPYFNYLLHVAACHAAGRPAPRFAEWEHAPLISPTAQRAIAAFAIAAWLLAFALYRVARRRGRAQPNAARDFFAQVGANTTAAPTTAAWTRPGFERPLAGLLTLLAAMLLFVGPYIALQWVLATHVQPFPAADGLWRATYEALWVAWLTFDLGTQTAFVKYFAEHRLARPDDALADVQFYLWWQIFARLAEASLLCAVAIGYLPWTPLAMYAPFVALYGACYVPAVSGVGKLMCQALQRFDYQNLLDMAEYRALVFIVPIPFVLAGRAWGVAHPTFGEAFGAALGLGVGQLATNLTMLALGLAVLARIHVPIRPLFLAQFTRATARRQLVFGLKLTLGQEPFRLTAFAESYIIASRLRDFTTWLGIRDLLSNRLVWLYFFAWGYYQSAVPALSEALTAGKRRLAQYYVARYFQWGFVFSAAILSLLLAVGPSFIAHALAPQWARAADYLVLAAAGGLLLPPAWISDSLQQGAGRPGTNTIVMLIEQGTRLGLFALLLPRFQFAGIYMAMLLALVLKAVVAWWVNHETILPLELPAWTGVAAPLLAGAVNFVCWRAAVALVDPQTPTAVLALFFAAGVGSFFVCFFACGLLGGLDEQALVELRAAADMSALVRPICRALAASARAGTRLCPRATRTPRLAVDAAAEVAALESSATR